MPVQAPAHVVATARAPPASGGDARWPIRPMLAQPADALPRDARAFGYEFKWDGFRTLLFLDHGQVRVQSRNLRDVTAAYPELSGMAAALTEDRSAVVDGELVVLDEDGRPSFQGMQRRSGFAGPASREPVTFVAFDLLHLDGEDLTARTYVQRREALDGLGWDHAAWFCPPWHRDGEAVREAAGAMGLEGVLAKRLDSPYEAGKRTGAWRKVKLLRREEFVVVGYTPGQGQRRRTFGALLLATREAEGAPLRFAGAVGTGFTDAMLEALAKALHELRIDAPAWTASPGAAVPPGAIPVEPALVAEVDYLTFTEEGLLRHATFKGLRSDKTADEVVRDGARAASSAQRGRDDPGQGRDPDDDHDHERAQEDA